MFCCCVLTEYHGSQAMLPEQLTLVMRSTYEVLQFLRGVMMFTWRLANPLRLPQYLLGTPRGTKTSEELRLSSHTVLGPGPLAVLSATARYPIPSGRAHPCPGVLEGSFPSFLAAGSPSIAGTVMYFRLKSDFSLGSLLTTLFDLCYHPGTSRYSWSLPRT